MTYNYAIEVNFVPEVCVQDLRSEIIYEDFIIGNIDQSQNITYYYMFLSYAFNTVSIVLEILVRFTVFLLYHVMIYNLYKKEHAFLCLGGHISYILV